MLVFERKKTFSGWLSFKETHHVFNFRGANDAGNYAQEAQCIESP